MGIMLGFFKTKDKKHKSGKRYKDFWIKTDFGFAPRNSIKVHFSGGTSTGYSLGGGTVISGMSKEYHHLKSLENHTYKMKSFLKGICKICDTVFLIPEHKKPIFFKCPICSENNEKDLIWYLLNLNPNDETFNKCPNCNNFSPLKVKNTVSHINFQCPKCNKTHILKKDNNIKIGKYSKDNYLLWCSACGYFFKFLRKNKEEIKCPHCDSIGKIIS